MAGLTHTFDGFAFRLATFYAALFLVSGIKITYLPVWLDWRGLTAAEISLVFSAPMFIRIVATPLLAYAADLSGDHRRALIGLAWFSVVLLAGLTGAGSFWPILALTLILSLASTTIMPLTETVAMEGVKRAGVDYGRMRLWGSASFIVSSFVAGVVVENVGAVAIVPMLVVTAIGTGLAAHGLPRRDKGADVAPARPPADGHATRKAPIALADVGRLLVSPRFALFLAAVGAVQAAHAMFYTFGVLHWGKQGVTPVMASALWATGVITEIAVFAFSGALLARIGARGLVIAGAGAAVLRWLVMAIDPPLWGLFPLQALHGLTYGATHVGAMHIMAAIVPAAHAGTAQALYASVTHGVALGLATLLAGKLYPAFGAGTYLAMAAIAAVGLAAGAMMARDHRSTAPA